MKVYITRSLPGVAVDRLKEAGFEVVVNESDRNLTKEELCSELEKDEYDGVISMLTDNVDKEILEKFSSIKIFANYAVGFNNIDIETAKARGVVITNTPGVLSQSVAEHTIALLLALSKRIVEADKFVRDGKYEGWAPSLLLGSDVQNKTLGLVGAGRIGTLVAKMAKKGFGMNVIYFDISRNEDIEKEGAVYKNVVEDVLRESDFVSIHVPLLETTKHLINKDTLSLMKKDAYLINTSRGPVINEKELAKALRNGVIRGAALDVYENEPNLTPGLSDLENVVLTPHTASATLETRTKMAEMVVDSIIDFFSGKEPQNKVV